MDFQPGTYTVDKIISLLRAGRLALPEFQRDFVWSPAKVVELLDSVSRGWPIGSLLLLRGPQPFEARAVDEAPALRGDVDVFVLDGQQRITALYHAIADVSEVCYYVDFDALRSQGQDYILWKKRTKFLEDFGTQKKRASRKIALVNEVADNELFYRWQSNLSGSLAQEILSLRENYLSGLKSKIYRLPVVELEHEIELEALARIFETINRTGWNRGQVHLSGKEPGSFAGAPHPTPRPQASEARAPHEKHRAQASTPRAPQSKPLAQAAEAEKRGQVYFLT